MMSNLNRQVERILDESCTDEVEVIVQMESSRGTPARLSRAAGQALSRRRFSLSPREVLPGVYKKRVTKAVKQSTASTRTLLGQATAETLALAKIQQLGLGPMDSLLKNGIVRAAVSSMLAPAKKSGAKTRGRKQPSQFWTSRSMPLRLEKAELRQLTEEVPKIQAVHRNRQLSVPSMMETNRIQAESDDILASTWGLEKIGALSVWGAYGARGQGVTVGVLDTGVDASHPDLKGKIAHWAELDSLGQVVAGSTPRDSDEHGTHCAGTVAGSDASGNFVGVAPEAKIAAALVLDGEVGGTDAQVLAGIDWAVEQGVDVLSLSLGGLVLDSETPPTYTEAILTCMNAGIPVVVAIGNEGHQTTGSPGNDLLALSIGATHISDRAAGFSGGRTQIIHESDFFDPNVLPLPYSKPDLSAPGVAIFSSTPGGNWKAFNGTSMATPHVAGAIALLLSATSIREKENGFRRAAVIQDLVVGSVEDLGESGQDQRYGFGRLNVLRAVDFARQRGY
jgi:hypothetical protein